MIRKFIEICDLHPVHGSYFREYSLDMRQFYTKCERDGYDWYRWEEVRKQCMSLEDMISALEDAGYRFKINEDNIIDFLTTHVLSTCIAQEEIDKCISVDETSMDKRKDLLIYKLIQGLQCTVSITLFKKAITRIDWPKPIINTLFYLKECFQSF